MKIKTFFYQNDQRKKLYKIRYKRKFLEYPYYMFMCKNKKVHAFLAPHCIIHHRLSENYIFKRTTFELNECITLLKSSGPIKWDNNFVHQAYLQHFHSSKTITTLYLERNSIGDEGTHHLANALKKNQVNDVHCVGIISSSSSFIVDHHDTESWA